MAAIVGLLTFSLAAIVRINRQYLQAADTLSLAIFSIIGVQVAIASSAFTPSSPIEYSVLQLMGLMTGVEGGLLRDVIGQQELKHLQSLLRSQQFQWFFSVYRFPFALRLTRRFASTQLSGLTVKRITRKFFQR